MHLIHKIRIQLGGILALVLLGGIVSPSLFAQQPTAVNRDPQARVEPPDRSVNAVDLDPEKAKQDAAAQARAVQEYSRWGLQRNQAQKTSLDRRAAAKPVSNWEHKNSPAGATALFEADRIKPLSGSKDFSGIKKYGTTKKAHTQPGQPQTKMPGSMAVAQPASGYMGSQKPAGALDFSSGLAFDPARQLSVNRASLKTRPRSAPSRSKADSYCRASTLSMEMKQLCAQRQKKRNRTVH